LIAGIPDPRHWFEIPGNDRYESGLFALKASVLKISLASTPSSSDLQSAVHCQTLPAMSHKPKALGALLNYHFGHLKPARTEVPDKRSRDGARLSAGPSGRA
jgi:hypothetical protein